MFVMNPFCSAAAVLTVAAAAVLVWPVLVFVSRGTQVVRVVIPSAGTGIVTRAYQSFERVIPYNANS